MSKIDPTRKRYDAVDAESLPVEPWNEISDCELCKNATQHVLEGVVCNQYLSVPDPASENEMHVVHLQKTLNFKTYLSSLVVK